MRNNSSKRCVKQKSHYELKCIPTQDWIPILILMAGYVVITVSLIIAWVILGVKYFDYCTISRERIGSVYFFSWLMIFPVLFSVISLLVGYILWRVKECDPLKSANPISKKSDNTEKAKEVQKLGVEVKPEEEKTHSEAEEADDDNIPDITTI